jgi:hypothetical protein
MKTWDNILELIKQYKTKNGHLPDAVILSKEDAEALGFPEFRLDQIPIMIRQDDGESFCAKLHSRTVNKA